MGVDLHLHSTASDGSVDPDQLPLVARKAGLHIIALTDHDTVRGVPLAQRAGRDADVTVISGCEFSVRVSWGELHLLGYFLPTQDEQLLGFLRACRDERTERAGAILDRLAQLGVTLDMADVRSVAGAGSIGRPHIARALVRNGSVRSLIEAFDRYLADGRPAHVERKLTDLRVVTGLVRLLGGVTSAAHLKQRATRPNLIELRDGGVDAVEVAHPAHDPTVVKLLNHEAERLGFLKTGGSDWHGPDDYRHERLGTMDVPESWFRRIEALHRERVVTEGTRSSE